MMYLVGHCSLNHVVAAPSLQQLLSFTICVFDNTPLPGYSEQPHEPDLGIEVPAHLQNNAGVLVRDSLINVFS